MTPCRTLKATVNRAQKEKLVVTIRPHKHGYTFKVAGQIFEFDEDGRLTND